MTVTDERRTPKKSFIVVEVGEVFVRHGDPYMKIEGNGVNAVNLEDGTTFRFDACEEVEEVEEVELILR